MRKEILQFCFNKSGRYPLNYRPFLFFLVLMASVLSLQAQVTVKGKVVDQTGLGLPGVSVKIKGSSAGTLTDIDGNYSVSAPNNQSVLVFTFIGFGTVERTVGSQSVINVSLAQDTRSLDQVVVVGYGTQKRADLTGAVATVDLEAVRNSPNTNIAQVLQGTVPGLNVGIGQSAGATPSIQIRGRVTLGGSQNVLIILDGIQYTGSLSSINPDDIASIDVLKDASSTAVYGAQAANGVILITTRKGQANKAPRINFTSQYTTQTPTVGDLVPYDRAGFIQQLTESFYERAYLAPDYTQPNPAFKIGDVVDASQRDANSNLLPNDYNWFNEATSNGSIFENTLSISGGSDKVNYLLSGATVDQKGFIINDIFKRKTIRANVELRPVDFLKVGLISSAALVNQDGQEASFSSIIRSSPLLVPYDDAGNLIVSPTKTLELNPFTTFYVDDLDRNNYLFANIYADVDVPFIKGLNYRVNFGNNYRNATRANASIYAANQTGQAYKNNQEYYDYTLDNILTYTKDFGKHSINTTLLYGASEREFNSTGARAVGFDRLNLSYNNLSLGSNQFTTSDGYREALNYQMARVNYKYNNKYLITATVRRDGFSGFASNNKSAIFPVVALGWVASEESFLKNSNAINYLKVRAGYGEIGNQTSRYSSLARVSTTDAAYIFGDGGSTAFGQFVSSLGNPNLKWERTRGLNLGLDFTVLNNRLAGNIEFYNNNTYDLLFDIALPGLTGFNNIQTNVGQIRNTGLEFSLSPKIINNDNFKWNATLNFATNKNRILKLSGIDANDDGVEDDIISSNLFIGKSIGTVYDYQLDGIYRIGDPLRTGYPVGSLRIVDQSNDDKITSDLDRVHLGRREEAYRFSILNSFSYKSFNLTFLLNSVQGGKDGYLGNNNPSYFREDNTIRVNYLKGIDFYSPLNPDGKYPRNISGSRANIEPNYWQDRSFVRLQDITLGYNFSSDWLKRIKAQSINLFVSGKNLYTWTKWEGWDPEAFTTVTENGTTREVYQGLTTEGRPVLRAFTLGINITY